MWELFKEFPQALENTLRIAESCDLEIPMGQNHLPTFPLPNNIPLAQSINCSYEKEFCFIIYKI